MLHELGINCSELGKIQKPEKDDTLPIVFVTLPNSIVYELSIERPKAPGPDGIDFENVTSCRMGLLSTVPLGTVNLAIEPEK